VRVDGAKKKPAEKLVAGAIVEVEPAPPQRTEAAPESGIAFDVLHADDAIVVVSKPAGLVVHPARGNESGTLVNGLLARGFFLAPSAEDDADQNAHLRPGIVHRLDKGTSGVMIVARTARAREALKAQFATHTIDREYEAICVGDTKARVHRTLHGRDPRDRLRFTTRVREGKTAITHVRVLERLRDGAATHVVCTLETGRTHQIRVHLAESGTPVLGDPLYGRPPKDRALRALASELGHQALHARLLGFTHPTSGERMRFEAPLPDDFARALESLGGRASP
jgi:23S rRNA pseudouridine1911/1915/1917 synthase